MTRLGVVTGMTAEARCLPRPGAGEALEVVCSGGDSARALAGASRLVAKGARALLSFGLAGGLDPALRSGAVVVAETVIAPDGERWETDRGWREALSAALAAARPVGGALAGCDRPLAGVAEKLSLYKATGACAVDMEGHAVARVAGESRVPFAVLRVVADPAGRALPRAALGALGADGRVRVAAVLSHLMRRPWETPALIVVAWDAGRALLALRRSAAAAPLFGCDAVR